MINNLKLEIRNSIEVKERLYNNTKELVKIENLIFEAIKSIKARRKSIFCGSHLLFHPYFYYSIFTCLRESSLSRCFSFSLTSSSFRMTSLAVKDDWIRSNSFCCRILTPRIEETVLLLPNNSGSKLFLFD